MNIRSIGWMIFTLFCLLLMQCAKKQESISKPILFINLVDTAGKNISGATVRLYKNAQDPGITQVSDTGGLVKFYNLDVALYYWLAKKGCKTNWNSQYTLNRLLIPGAVLYGNSVMTETGTLIITNTSAERYKVSDSLFNITLSKDTPYIAHPAIGRYTIHSEKISTPGIGKDTLIQIQCGDTSFIKLPY